MTAPAQRTQTCPTCGGKTRRHCQAAKSEGYCPWRTCDRCQIDRDRSGHQIDHTT